MYRIIGTFATLIALSLLGWAGYLATAPVESNTGLVVEEMEIDLGERSVGVSVVTVRVRNPTRTERRIVSLPGNCGRNCCFFPKESGPRVIAPNSVLDIDGELRVMEPGAFEFIGQLYLDDDGLRTVPIRIRGTGIPTGAASDAISTP